MKRGTPDHWKMKDLARRLNIPPMYAISWANGCMERIWHYAARYCLQGDIGRVPDEEIAEVVGWPTKAARRLVDALTESRWLDRCPTHRLLIHDWHEHCDESVKKTLRNRKLEFIFPEKSGMIRESSGLARAEALAFPKPLPSHSQKPDAPLVPDFTSDELELAHEGHRKQRAGHSLNVAAQKIIGMNGKFDVAKFRERHPRYREYWEKAGWKFCPLSLVEWIENGMPEPPPTENSKQDEIEQAMIAGRRVG